MSTMEVPIQPLSALPPIISAFNPRLSAAQRVHDTPELLRLILRHLAPIDPESKKQVFRNLAISSWVLWRHLARMTYRKVTWAKYLDLKAIEVDRLRREAMSMIRELTYESWRGATQVASVFAPKTLLRIKDDCPHLHRITSQPQEADRIIVTFEDGKLPNLSRRHVVHLKSLDRVRSCGKRWRVPSWTGWEVSGTLDLMVQAQGDGWWDGSWDTATEYDAAKGRFIQALASAGSPATPISRLLLSPLVWTLEEIQLMILRKTSVSDHERPICPQTITEIFVETAHFFTLTSFKQFATAVGSQLTSLTLNVRDDIGFFSEMSPSLTISALELPDMLDTVRQWMLSLVDLTLTLPYWTPTTLTTVGTSFEDDAALAQTVWGSASELKNMKVQIQSGHGGDLTSLAVFNLVRRLILREDLFKRWNAPDIFTLCYYTDTQGPRNSIQMLLSHFRAASPEVRNAFFQANLAELQLHDPLEIQTLSLLPNGSYPSWKARALLRVVDTAKQSIHEVHRLSRQYHVMLNGHKWNLDTAGRIHTEHYLPALAKADSKRQETEQALEELSSIGISVDMPVWPQRNDISDVTGKPLESLDEAKEEIMSLKARNLELERLLQIERTDWLMALRDEHDLEEELARLVEENVELRADSEAAHGDLAMRDVEQGLTALGLSRMDWG